MEETKTNDISEANGKIEEVLKLFRTSVFLIRQKLAELEKELKEEKDLEKIELIKNRINKINDL